MTALRQDASMNFVVVLKKEDQKFVASGYRGFHDDRTDKFCHKWYFNVKQ